MNRISLKKFIGRVILILNIVAVVCLLLTYLANYISPAQWWAFGFIGMAYPFILIANVLCVMYWGIRRRKEFLLSFLAILLGWGVVRRTFQLNIVRKNHNRENAIKIMTYNVRSFNLYQEDSKLENRDSILVLIDKMKPTILCLQEYRVNNHIDSLSDVSIKTSLAFLPYRHIHMKKKESGNGNYGIATYSAYPIVNKGRFEFNHSVNMFIYSDLVIGNDTVRVFNMHLESTGIRQKEFDVVDHFMLDLDKEKLREVKRISKHLRDAFIKRSEQVDLLAELIGNSPYPVIICGDFNDTPVSYAYHKLRRRLKDAYIEAGNGKSITYYKSFPSFRIDYVLHDRKYKARYYKTLHVNYSDHYPVYCVITKK